MVKKQSKKIRFYSQKRWKKYTTTPNKNHAIRLKVEIFEYIVETINIFLQKTLYFRMDYLKYEMKISIFPNKSMNQLKPISQFSQYGFLPC